MKTYSSLLDDVLSSSSGIIIRTSSGEVMPLSDAIKELLEETQADCNIRLMYRSRYATECVIESLEKVLMLCNNHYNNTDPIEIELAQERGILRMMIDLMESCDD